MSSNELAIVYTTTIHIPDYARYYSDIPIQLFQPTYLALPDGSLVAQPLIDDIGKSMADALISGVFAMLFLRNIFVSGLYSNSLLRVVTMFWKERANGGLNSIGDYLYRAVIASKMLLWALFISQAVAFVSLLPVIASFWRPWIDCRMYGSIILPHDQIQLTNGVYVPLVYSRSPLSELTCRLLFWYASHVTRVWMLLT